MDDISFDTLAKAVSATRSRRVALRLLASGAAASLLARLGAGRAAAQATCLPTGARCGAGAECCSRLCTGRCVCRAVEERCVLNAHCCSGVCRDGECGCQDSRDCRRGVGRFCCGDRRCHGCCDHDDCLADPDVKCCLADPDVTLLRNHCVYDSECGRDADCGIGNLCEGCERCVCDPEKCGQSDLAGCCPPERGEYCVFGDGSSDDSGRRSKYCGKAGEICKICNLARGQTCDPTQRRCVCDAAKCRRRAGCCHRTRKTCEPGDQPTACGTGGRTCADCAAKGAGWVCQNKRCCRRSGTCPAGCPTDGACAQCCGGDCANGQCGEVCVPAGGRCPAGCNESGVCPQCCTGGCARGSCCVFNGAVCPSDCPTDGPCPACCLGKCTGGVCNPDCCGQGFEYGICCRSTQQCLVDNAVNCPLPTGGTYTCSPGSHCCAGSAANAWSCQGQPDCPDGQTLRDPATCPD